MNNDIYNKSNDNTLKNNSKFENYRNSINNPSKNLVNTDINMNKKKTYKHHYLFDLEVFQ